MRERCQFSVPSRRQESTPGAFFVNEQGLELFWFPASFPYSCIQLASRPPSAVTTEDSSAPSHWLPMMSYTGGQEDPAAFPGARRDWPFPLQGNFRKKGYKCI